MIKPRKRFLAVIVIMAVIFFWVDSYIHSPEFESFIKKGVEDALSDSFEGDINVEKISLGFFSVKISGANISIPVNSVQLDIDDIKVGFSLGALLRKKWTADELIDKIILINPVVTYEPLLETEGEEVEVLPSDIAEAVLTNMKIRELVIRNCDLVVVNKKGKAIFTVENLDGYALKKSGQFLLTLQNKKHLSRNKFTIELLIDRDIQAQHLSVQAEKYKIKSVINNKNEVVHGLLDGSLEFSFVDKPYPSCLIPEGSFDIKDLSLKRKKRTIWKCDSLSFIAQNGILSSDNLRVDFGSSQLTGTLSTSLSDQFLLFGLHWQDSALGVIAHAVVEHDSTMTFGEFSHSFSALKDSMVVSGKGLLNPSGIELHEGSFTMPGLAGSLTAKIDSTGVYSGTYEGGYTQKLDSLTSVKGDFSLQFNGQKLIPPTVKGDVGCQLLYDSLAVALPQMQVLLSSKGTLEFQGGNKEVSLSGSVESVYDDKLPPVVAELSLKGRLLKRLEKKFNGTELLTNGTLNLGVRYEKDSIPMVISGNIETLEGDLNLRGKMTVTGSDTVKFDFPLLQITRDSLSMPCKLSGTKKSDFLSFSLSSSPFNLRGSGIVDLAQGELLTTEISMKNCKLSQFNGLIPQLQDMQHGKISTTVKARGSFDSLYIFGDVKGDSLQTDGVKMLSFETAYSFQQNRFELRPFFITSAEDTLIRIDSLTYDSTLYLDGEFHNLSLSSVIDDRRVPRGEFSGVVKSVDEEGLYIVLTSDSLRYDETFVDSFSAVMHLRERSLYIDTASAKLHDLFVKGSAVVPLGEESTRDSLTFDIAVKGDLLKTLGKYKVSAVSGSSDFEGAFAGAISSGKMSVTKGKFRLRNGSMGVFPNLWEPMDSVWMDWDIHRSDSMDIIVEGKIKRRRLRVRNSYRTSDSLQPFTFGFLNFGTLIVETPDGALPIFIPGFQENRKGNSTMVAVKGKPGVRKFTLSGPFEKFKVSGTLLLRKSEFTFPLLDDVVYPVPFDPFPYITFDLDIRPADRSVTYFYQIGESRKRRGLRMIEADLDPSETISLRGRDLDKTFRILGGLRAYRGYLFYGTVFDRNFEMGLDFRPELMSNGAYDNLPIIWGSAENQMSAGKAEQARQTVKVMVKDSTTGELVEHARFGELVIMPAVGANEEKSYDEKSALFYTETGRNFGDPARAGEMVSSIGDDYFNTVWLNFWGRRLARKIGFDVLRFETSLLSNSYSYFYERSLSPEYNTSFGVWALENSGITMGKYVGDNLLLKAQTSLIVLDTSLTPSYNLGFEYQPFRYLWMDFHYGMHQNSLTDELQFDPTFQLQMRVPLEDFKKVFKKSE